MVRGGEGEVLGPGPGSHRFACYEITIYGLFGWRTRWIRLDAKKCVAVLSDDAFSSVAITPERGEFKEFRNRYRL